MEREEAGLLDFIPQSWWNFVEPVVTKVVPSTESLMTRTSPSSQGAEVNSPPVTALVIREPELIHAEVIPEIPKFLADRLRKFQIEGVYYAISKHRTFIADEMGLGKTLQALASVEILDGYPCLVVCPASLKYNWEAEISKWLPHRTTKILSGDGGIHLLMGTLKNDANIQIVNYDMLKAYCDTLVSWGFKSIIFDESHYLKNADAKRTLFGTKVSQEAENIFLLTGTAVLNRPTELIPQLKIIKTIDKFGGPYRFERDFTWKYGPMKGMVKNLDSLNSQMRKLCYIRRLKKEVMNELPPKQRQYINLDIVNRQDYIKARTNLYEYLRDQAIGKGGLEEFLKKDTNAMANTLAQIEYLKQVCARGKMPLVIERIEDFLEESDDKLVVFANHIEIQKGILEKFPSAAHLLGEDTLEARNYNVNRFQNDIDCRLIICSLNVGGLGINLTASSNVYFVELGWNPAIHDQAEDRTHRIGQYESVNITYFLGKDTIDEDIFELIEKKRVIVDATLEGNVTEERFNIFNELIQRLRRKV